ncbi:MAG: hypothetical protein EPGJADBJ_01482 [Saprospiraceae bacterium]|nr:hypothetical protein [Saprospiraceae bacterium]
MITIQFLRHCLILGALTLSVTACQKQEDMDIDADIEFQDIVTTDLGNGDKKLDFTVVVTQIGNSFYRDYRMTLTKFNDKETVLDSAYITLPTAREFVKHSVQPLQPGNYWINVQLHLDDLNYTGYGTMITVP